MLDRACRSSVVQFLFLRRLALRQYHQQHGDDHRRYPTGDRENTVHLCHRTATFLWHGRPAHVCAFSRAHGRAAHATRAHATRPGIFVPHRRQYAASGGSGARQLSCGQFASRYTDVGTCTAGRMLTSTSRCRRAMSLRNPARRADDITSLRPRRQHDRHRPIRSDGAHQPTGDKPRRAEANMPAGRTDRTDAVTLDS